MPCIRASGCTPEGLGRQLALTNERRQRYGAAMATSPEDPAAAIAAVIGLRRLADRMEREAVERAVDEGWTWQQIAQALGVTRQAAHKRHSARLRARGRRTEESG